MKPCANCGTGFWCVPSREAGSRHGETKYCSNPCALFVKANQDDVELFTRKVQRGSDDACWPFMGARVPAGGYGRAFLNGKLIAAHRIAWMLANGNIPAGRDIMHWRCDNPPCCNPRHLRPGTEKENMMDMRRKGRDGTATLTPEQVREIREALKTPYHGIGRALSKKYNVLPGVISDIKVGGTYQWIE